jgi:hypothetical protein
LGVRVTAGLFFFQRNLQSFHFHLRCTLQAGLLWL